MPTYNDLKTAVQTWGKRTDSATISAIPQFIQAAQNKLDTILLIPQMLETKNYTAVDSFPLDFLKTDVVLIGELVAVAVPLDVVMLRREVDCLSDNAPVYAVNGDTAVMVQAADVSVTGYQKPPRLSDAVQTNAYTEGAFNALLWLALAYMGIFAKDKQMTTAYNEMANEEIADLNAASDAYLSAGGIADTRIIRSF